MYAQAHTLEPATGAPLILVVEDDEHVLEIVLHILQSAGYAVWGSTDPQEALAYARTMRPAVILSDIMMPGLDGFDLCTMIKDHRDTRAIPFVFLSAKAGVGDRLLGRYCGGAAHLAKPFRRDTLLSTIRRMLADSATCLHHG